MSITFESVACPGCGAPKSRLFLEVTDRFLVLPDQSYSIVECVSCSLLFLNPRPDESSIAAFYDTDEYDPFGSDDGAKGLSAKLYQFARPFSIRRKAARVVNGLNSGARTLDVGCATGEFMRELSRRGFAPEGVEPDPGAAAFAQKQGLKVTHGGIEALPETSGPYALISYWHVLEHVHRLRENLERCFQLLESGGRLAIAVPNPDSWDAKAYGKQWVAWDTPRHLYHFRPPVMLELLRRHGFEPQHAGAVAFDAFYQSVLSESKSPVGLLRGGTRGLISYLRGLSGKYGSSELYLAFKP